jgi:hypothetical protein
MYIFRVFILLLCCCGVVFLAQPTPAQQKYDYSCTLIDLSYPTYIVSGRKPIPLSVEVLGANEVLGEETAKRLKYVWTVSGGTVIRGEGTSSILVSALPASGHPVLTLPIKLKLEGGEPACETEKSFSISIDTECSPPKKFDEYGDLPFQQEKSRLDALAAKLATRGPFSKLYIIAYSGRAYCLWEEAMLRAKRARRYLIEQHGIDAERIIAADNGFRENLTVELFIARPGSCGPLPTATVRRSEARWDGGSCREKYMKRQEPIEP